MTNKIFEMLVQLGICSSDSLKPYYPEVRDRKDVSVLRCSQSGVILLSSSTHIDISHYQNEPTSAGWDAQQHSRALATTEKDDQRRFQYFKECFKNKIWIDVGAENGGLLALAKDLAAEAIAVEPKNSAREILDKLGYQTFSTVDKVTRTDIELITLFHVFEHIFEPIEFLQDCKKIIKPGGKIIIEVPHANDFLLSFLDLDAFKKFTFWSEHLILHTRESLRSMLAFTGFKNIVITGVQRYGFANHLHWLKEGLPGGHLQWAHLSNPNLDHEYEAMLASNNLTDTIIATAEA